MSGKYKNTYLGWPISLKYAKTICTTPAIDFPGYPRLCTVNPVFLFNKYGHTYSFGTPEPQV